MSRDPYKFTDEDDDWIKVEPSDTIPDVAYIRTSEIGVNVSSHEAPKLALAILKMAGSTSNAVEALEEQIEADEKVEQFKEIQKRRMDIIRPYGYTAYQSAPPVVRHLTDKILKLEDGDADV